jgi:hypothetical protein
MHKFLYIKFIFYVSIFSLTACDKSSVDIPSSDDKGQKVILNGQSYNTYGDEPSFLAYECNNTFSINSNLVYFNAYFYNLDDTSYYPEYTIEFHCNKDDLPSNIGKDVSSLIVIDDSGLFFEINPYWKSYEIKSGTIILKEYNTKQIVLDFINTHWEYEYTTLWECSKTGSLSLKGIIPFSDDN